MKVILIEDTPNLGRQGDTVEVRDGYARNFLFPKKLAMPATKESLSFIEELKRKKTMKLEKERKEAEALGERLSYISCTIPVKAGADDRLYGSVTSEIIARAFELEGINIDKERIVLEEPIKALGVYQVTIKLHHEVEARVKVWVVRE